MIEIDMEIARDIHRDSLREQRAPLLEQLDIEYQRALEQSDGDTMESIVEYKQALRDITNDSRFETAETINDLEKIKLPAR